MCILLFKILIVGIYLVITDIPTILCSISVIWNVCLKILVKSFFRSIVRVGTMNNWIFPNFFKLNPCAVANLLEVLEGINFGCKFQVGMFILFDSAPESIKKINFEVW